MPPQRPGSPAIAFAVGALTLVAVIALFQVVLEAPSSTPCSSSLAPGPFRAALVYGTPNTWDGFRYIVLAEQFRGSLVDPFGDLPRKFGELVGRTNAQLGILSLLIPVAFVVTAVRRPRYALLTGSALAITCFFAASYDNADIDRYYLGPALMAWTWLAVLAAAAIDVLRHAADPGTRPASDRHGPRRRIPWAGLGAIVLGLVLIAPTVAAIPHRLPAVDESHETEAAGWADHALEVMEPGALIVSWWSYSTTLWYEQLVEGRRPDIAIVDDRTRIDDDLGSIEDVIDANLGKRPVYVIRLDRSDVDALAKRYDLDYVDGYDATELTRVVGRRVGT
jgi:hypothetical protein